MHFWSDLLYLQVGGLYFFNDKDTSMVYGLSLLGTTETSPDQLWKQAAYKLFSAESIFKLVSIKKILSTQNTVRQILWIRVVSFLCMSTQQHHKKINDYVTTQES